MPIRIGGSNPTRFEPKGPAFERSPTIIGALSGLSEMALGVGFIVTWVNPAVFGNEMVRFALELMLLEFILIHSSGFMGLKANADATVVKRIGWFTGLGAFYSLFVLGFCLSLDTWRPMIAFWVITVQRLGGSLYDPKPSGESKAWFGADLALHAMLYLGAVFLSVLVPLPRLGVTTEIRNALGVNGSGLWQSEPHRVVVVAALYYFWRGYFTATARPRKTWPAPAKS